MTADTGLDADRRGEDADRYRAPRAPAMQEYCATLSRFTSSVQSTELMLRHEEATIADEAEQVEQATASRLRGIERARAEAQSGLDHTAAVRQAHGVASTDPAVDTGRTPRRRIGGDLGIALTSLARRRDELRAAEEEFDTWSRSQDQNAQRVVLGAAAAVGVIGAAVLVVVGMSSSPGLTLSLLIAITGAITGTGLAAGTLVRLPVLCTGPTLIREPQATALTRFGAILACVAAAGLAAVAIASGAL